MKTNYRFLWDSEPTEEQLQIIMKEAAEEAKKKAKIANDLFWKQLYEMVDEMKKNQISKKIEEK